MERLHLHDNVLNLNYNSDVNNDKVLGVLIDNNLTWSSHKQPIAKKIYNIVLMFYYK